MTSGSAMNPPGLPRWSSVNPSGTSDDGSTGSDASGARAAGVVRLALGVQPVPDREGTPKNRCRLISQSPLRPSTQFS